MIELSEDSGEERLRLAIVAKAIAACLCIALQQRSKHGCLRVRSSVFRRDAYFTVEIAGDDDSVWGIPSRTVKLSFPIQQTMTPRTIARVADALCASVIGEKVRTRR